MSAPIYNPVVPFNSGITLRPGFMVFINGTPTGGRFSVNFLTGHGPSSDNVFHFNPRFDAGNIVVRNTRTGGNWGAEERHSNGFPFVMGQPFELIILCQPHQYKLAVNGRHYTEYSHRMNMSTVKALTIQGAVKLSVVRFDQESPPPVQAMAQKVFHNPSIPYMAVVPFNNIKNRKVTITGVPQNRHPHRMTFDFQTDDAHPNIFFHFNPRFTERVLVRNSLQNGGWGKEEKQLGVPFPFQYSVPYQLTIFVDQHSFRVELNGMQFCTFNHRQRPLNRIRNINISGSTSVSRIAFE